jgi:DnaD/phage-associated family protein
MEFSGFPPGVHATSIPDPVLGFLLEQIDDLAELKVTLRGFWLANQKKGALRTVPYSEFLNDKVLVEGLRGIDTSPQETIQRGLALAVKRQTFLIFKSDPTRPDYTVYAVNTESGRRALVRLQASYDGSLPERTHTSNYDETYAETPKTTKPNIFGLYENNIGTISPILAEKLKEAEDLYPRPWIGEAFQIAVTQNKRSWAYISAILRRWVDEGKDDGESGRHSQKDNPTNHLEEYRQLRGHLPWESGDR